MKRLKDLRDVFFRIRKTARKHLQTIRCHTPFTAKGPRVRTADAVDTAAPINNLSSEEKVRSWGYSMSSAVRKNPCKFQCFICATNIRLQPSEKKKQAAAAHTAVVVWFSRTSLRRFVLRFFIADLFRPSGHLVTAKNQVLLAPSSCLQIFLRVFRVCHTNLAPAELWKGNKWYVPRNSAEQKCDSLLKHVPTPTLLGQQWFFLVC